MSVTKIAYPLPQYRGSKMGSKEVVIREDEHVRQLRSEDYNYNFNKKTGFFARWGADPKDDPVVGLAPEILDIEITTICGGVKGLDGVETPCKFCYKGNTLNGVNMTFEQFKTIIDKMPPTLTQMALGSDGHATSNPDTFKMMEYARSKGIIPNITIADISDEIADQLAKYCGGVAVSRYADKNLCYDSVKRLTDRGVGQVNIHILVSEETYDQVVETLYDRVSDPRLEKLNAIVMLSLKRKSRGTTFHSVTPQQYKKLVDLSLALDVGIGFDSCSASSFLHAIQSHKNYKSMEMMTEPCEATLFSSYINARGRFFPCSFSDKTIWADGLDVLAATSFIDDIWNHPKTIAFRDKLLDSTRNNKMGCRECVIFEDTQLHPQTLPEGALLEWERAKNSKT